MADIVATVPKWRWEDWLAEGDCAGDPPTGESYLFTVGRGWPEVDEGDRFYIVAWGRVRGYAPIIKADATGAGVVVVRAGGAVAVTVPQPVTGFRGWRYRWWERSVEFPFPGWKTEGVGTWVKPNQGA